MKNVFESVRFIYKGETHSIEYGLNNGGSSCIRIFNAQGYTINSNGTTKKILLDINQVLGLKVDIFNSTNGKKITHQLGKHMIRAIKNRNIYAS
jgi:hypothetical protein